MIWTRQLGTITKLFNKNGVNYLVSIRENDAAKYFTVRSGHNVVSRFPINSTDLPSAQREAEGILIGQGYFSGGTFHTGTSSTPVTTVTLATMWKQATVQAIINYYITTYTVVASVSGITSALGTHTITAAMNAASIMSHNSLAAITTRTLITKTLLSSITSQILKTRSAQATLQAITSSILAATRTSGTSTIIRGIDYLSNITTTPGLTNYYRLNDTTLTSGSPIIDSVGSDNGSAQNTGLTSGAGLITNDTNKAIVFNSSGTGCINLGTRLTPLGNAQYTWETWINPSNASARTERIIGNDVYGTQNTGPSLLWDNTYSVNSIQAWRASDSVQVSCGFGGSPVGKTWHIALTYDGAQMRLYLNGAFQNAQLDSTSVPSNTNNFSIGANGGWGNCFNGTIDEVAFYNTALSGEVIRDHYNAGVKNHITQQQSIFYGAFLNNGTNVWVNDYTEMDTWSNLATNNGATSHTPKVYHMFLDWAHNPTMPAGPGNAAAARGATTMVSWEAWDSVSGSSDQPAYSYQNILNGNFDTYIDGFADSIKTYGRPLFIRLFHEFNLSNYPWSASSNTNQGDYTVKNTPALMVSAWQYVWNRVYNRGVRNVKWVWCVNGWSDKRNYQNVTSAYYPGDSYVDYLGIDNYNYGANSTTAPYTYTGGIWQVPMDLFTLAYDTITTISTKPVIICEFGSADTDTVYSKAAWFNSLMNIDIRDYLPNIVGFICFDEAQTGVSSGRDWRINSTTAALTAFQKNVAMPAFGAPVPLPLTSSPTATAAVNALTSGSVPQYGKAQYGTSRYGA